MRDADLTSQDVAKLPAPTDLMSREWAPCRWNCPVHADVRTYIEKAAQGDFLAAINVIRQHLPFACVCGRICHHPCEGNCRRNDVDKPVAIREVKRFVGEMAGAKATVRKAARQDKARVAIVGAGPAGLSAALLLAQRGYRPTVFEKFPVAGGIPATAIPKYRLPREVLQMDVDWICSHGVELRTGIEIGKDKTLADLTKEGFAAVLVAAGLAKSRTLPLPGAASKRVLPVLKFLEELAFDRTPDIGKNVIVVGGGNVAVDTARSALRMGAGRANDDARKRKGNARVRVEQDEAKEEGITFTHRRGPVEVLVEGGQIVGLKARKVTRVFDEAKRFNPAYDDSDVITLECDTVIMAIGQMADTGFVKGSDLKLDERGRLTYNKFTQQTNLPAVFACGEIVTPPGSAVEACASGKRAAAAIDLFLSGRDIAIDDTLPPFIDKIAPKTAEKVIKVDRQKVPTDSPGTRKHCWTETDHNYSPAAALAEARRCMNCGSGAEVLVDKCAACLTCAGSARSGIPKVTDVARIESTLCQACGICIAECPANAIVSRSNKPAELSARVSAALSGEGPRSIAFVCGHTPPKRPIPGRPRFRWPSFPNASRTSPSISRVITRTSIRAAGFSSWWASAVACSTFSRPRTKRATIS